MGGGLRVRYLAGTKRRWHVENGEERVGGGLGDPAPGLLEEPDVQRSSQTLQEKLEDSARSSSP